MIGESNVQIQEYMVDYVINLFDDANDFFWVSAKGGQGEVTGCSNVENIDHIHRVHAQRQIGKLQF